MNRTQILASLFLLIFVSANSLRAGTTDAIFPGNEQPHLVSDQFELADGAAWDGAGQLFVPDVKGKRLLRFNLRKPDSQPNTLMEDIGFSGTCFQTGKLFLADNRGHRIVELKGLTGKNRTLKTIATFEPKERPNDLTVDSAGNIYVTMTGQGSVYKIEPDGTQSVIASNLITPNGIALSPAGQTLYVSSAKSGKLYRIELSDQRPSNSAVMDFAQLPETANGFRGDGMCVDRAGNLYVTAAESVFVFSPNGTQIDSIKTPHRPINAILAGKDSQTLYISTFGGLYSMPTRAYGVMPNKPMIGSGDSAIHTNIDDSVTASLNIVFHQDGQRKLLMDLFQPSKGAAPKPAIIVVHGGGWKNGDKTKFRALALRLAEIGYVTAAIEYRLAGEATFPTAIKDCNAATRFLKENSDQWGIDPNRIAAVGGSAGGHLVGLMAAAHANPKLKFQEHAASDASLKAAIVMAGPLEIASGSVAERSMANPEASNSVRWMNGNVQQQAELYHLADAFEQVSETMPPTLFLCGSKDNPQRNAKTRAKMSSMGIHNQLIVHENATHGHWNRAEWIGRVVSDIDAFLKQHL